jgi:hypothetical protein
MRGASPDLKPVKGNRAILWTIIIYSAMVLLFTFVSLGSSPPGSQTGLLRTVSTIPEHLVYLGGFGIVLGLVGSAIYRRLDPNLIILIPALVILTDLDHLPVALRIAQPIRPAHSLIFIISVVAILALTIRRPDIEAASVSAFFAHLSVDTGQFPPFSPFSFEYANLSAYQPEIIAAAIISALVAGYLARRARPTGAT